jgi:uncharacterized protein (TIGR02246 family)
MADEIEGLYAAMIAGWNAQDGDAMARPFAADATVVGFDGSIQSGRETIAKQMNEIFRDHATARYVTKVLSVRPLGRDAVLLRAIAGLVPPGQTKVKAELNAHHFAVAELHEGRWQLVLYQNTPAQFHGRPDLAEAMTAELQEIADSHAPADR